MGLEQPEPVSAALCGETLVTERQEGVSADVQIRVHVWATWGMSVTCHPSSQASSEQEGAGV